MLWIDRVRLTMRRGWDRVDATLVDSRFVKRKVWGGESPGSFEIWEYMVDVPGRSGGAVVRLTFTEKQFKVRGAPERGNVVPVIVNAKRTKLMFNLSDPRIDQEGWVDEQVRRRKQRDDERFEARRAGREPEPDPDDTERRRSGSHRLETTTVGAMLWSVQNRIGAVGLPVAEWAAAANALLRDDASVRWSDVSATYERDELALDGSRLAGLSVHVLIAAADAVSAAELVELSVTQALFDVVGDREVGWTADDWKAIPAQN
jgi:hypothetical protein